MDLPEDLCLFPLTGVLLLPKGNLPLQVFEPRYLAMTEAVLRSGRHLGIIQPMAATQDPVPDDAPLSHVGCVGKLVGFEETDQGRFRIRLLGVNRFRLLSTQVHPAGYRVGRVSYEGFTDDQSLTDEALADRAKLETAIRTYCETRDIQPDWKTVKEASDEALVTSFSMICPMDPQEKQALLECHSVAERGDMLISLLELASHSQDSATTVRH